MPGFVAFSFAGDCEPDASDRGERSKPALANRVHDSDPLPERTPPMDIRNEVAVWIRKITPPLLGLSLLAALTAVPTMVEAQTLYSNQGEVQVTAQRFPESLTLSVSPQIISFTLSSNGNSTANTPMTTIVDYVLDPATGQTYQGKVSYFFMGSDALANSSGVIPASAFTAMFESDQSAPHPFQSLAEGGIGAQDVFTAVGSGTAVSTATLHVNTAGITLAAEPYVGTLFVQAQVH